jgi:hypothetical protein
VLVLIGTVHELAHGISAGRGSVNIAVTVLDRILLTLIIAELVYTLRFVLRTHQIAVEPFLFIGLIAVVRRILIVTAQFERPPAGGRASPTSCSNSASSASSRSPSLWPSSSFAAGGAPRTSGDRKTRLVRSTATSGGRTEEPLSSAE